MMRMVSRCGIRALAPLFAALAPAAPAWATADPANDFLATYAFEQVGALDIRDVGAVFDGNGYKLTATLGGTPFGATNSLYAWGINRGAGTARFQVLGAPPPVGADVLFDALLVLFADGSTRTVVFNPAGPPTITLAGMSTVVGNTISGYAPLSLLPSTGFAPEDYTFTLWSRRRITPAFDTNNTEIADFAPTIGAAAVPEPASWALMILGFGAVGAAARRGKRGGLAAAR